MIKTNLNLKKVLLIVLFCQMTSDMIAALRRLKGRLIPANEFLKTTNTNMSGIKELFSQENWVQKTERYVVLDEFPVPQWLIINSSLAREIAQELAASPKVFAFRRPSKSSISINAAFGLRDFLIIRLNIGSWKKLRSEYAKILSYLDTRSNLIEYKIGDIPIGLDIYESILRLGRKTVSLEDLQTYRIICLALKQYCFFEPLFASKRVAAVLVSHDNYVGPGLLSHMAFSFKIPVILANTISLSMPTAPFQLYEKFERFGIYSKELPPKELAAGISWAESELGDRLEGEVGIGMDYQLKSAFTAHRINRQTSDTKNTKVLILTHDFFDNPHGYRRMLFDDFYLWLEFLSEISSCTDHEWYIKPHRDYSSLEIQILNDFVKRNPQMNIIDSETSYHQLKMEGVKFALTCYGSAGHELPLLGFTVINASYNPHVSYSFNIHAKSVDDYRRILMDLPNRTLNKVNFNDIFEYYFIHKTFLDQDTLMGISQKELSKVSQGDLYGEKAIKYLEKHAKTIHSRAIQVLRETVSSKLVYAFESAIKEDTQLKVQISSSNQEFYEKLGC